MELDVKVGPDHPIESWCTYCWKDRTLTTNGKCRVCGTELIKRHWKTSIKKLEIMLAHPDMRPIEIKGKMYLVSLKEIEKFSVMENYSDKVKFIEHIKEKCQSYKI